MTRRDRIVRLARQVAREDIKAPLSDVDRRAAHDLLATCGVSPAMPWQDGTSVPMRDRSDAYVRSAALAAASMELGLGVTTSAYPELRALLAAEEARG